MTAKSSAFATSILRDAPLVQDAAYKFDADDRQYIDVQILGIQDRLLEALLDGITATWYTLDGSSATAEAGDVVCVAADHKTVTRATTTPIQAAGIARGIVLRAATPGAKVLVATDGIIPPSITGLAADPGYVRVNPSTARCERVDLLSEDDYPLGIVTTRGQLTLERRSVVLPGGSGGVVSANVSARALSASNLSLSGGATIDGLSLADGEKVLAIGQTAPAQNGVWVVNTGGAWGRATEADSGTELPGLTVSVTEGTTYADTIWQCVTNAPVTVGSTALSWSQIPNTADKPRINRLNAQQLAAEVSLTNADQTLTIAGGQRYLLAGSTQTAPRTKTIQNTGAIEGDKIYFRTEPRSATGAYHPTIIKNAAGAVILSFTCSDARVYVVEFDGTSWKGASQAGMQVFNVKDFGAQGDERLTILNTAAEAAAIQACIDAAAACARDVFRDGAAIYFPPGRYRTDGHPLIWRRTPYNAPLHFFGAGMGMSMIANSTGVGPNGDVFRSETIAETEATNPTHTWGAERHSMRDLGIIGKHFGINWDLGDEADEFPTAAETDGVRGSPIFHRCYFSRTFSPGSCVRWRRPSRARFTECVVNVANFMNGTGGVEIIRGSCSFVSCRGGGQLVRVREGGEISMLACRVEGGRGIPGVEFVKCFSVHVDNFSSEGHDERGAILLFDECKYVSCDNTVLATPDRSHIHMSGLVAITGAPTITFSHEDATSGHVAANEIHRSTGSWFEDFIGNGSKVKIDGAIEPNDGWLTVIEATHDTLRVAETVVANVVPGATGFGTQYVLTNTLQPSITFDDGGGTGTITRTAGATPGAGSWDVDGFEVGMVITTTAPLNPGPFTITNVTDTVLTVDEAVVDEGPLAGRVVLAKQIADGILLRKCLGFHVRNSASSAKFSDLGDTTKHAIRVDADCRDGTVEHSHQSVGTDISIDPGAFNVTGECHGHSDTVGVRATYWHGKKTFADLDLQSDMLRLRTNAATIPASGVWCGISFRRGPLGVGVGEQQAVGLYWSETNQRAYVCYTPDEASAGTAVDFQIKRIIGPSGDSCAMVAQLGQACHFYTSTATLADTLRMSVVGPDLIFNNITRLWRVGAPLNVECSTLTLNGTTQTDLYGGGLLGVRVTSAGAKVCAATLSSPSTGTGISTNQEGIVRRAVHVRSFTFAAFQVAAVQKVLRAFSLPAKTRVVGAWLDTSTAFTGAGLSAVTLRVGIEDVAADCLILSHDVLTTPVVKGLADGDLGAGLARATSVQGGVMGSWTLAKELRLQMDGDANLSLLTTGQVALHVIVEYLGTA